MSVLFATSFDHYQTAQILKRFNTAGATGPGEIIPAAGRCGSQALRYAFIGEVTKGLNLHAGATVNVGFWGCAVKPTLITFNDPFMSIIDIDGSTEQFTGYITTTGAIVITDAFLNIIATTPNGIVNVGEYGFIEIGFVIHRTLGQLTIRFNNVQLAHVTGVNTQGGFNAAYGGFRLKNSNNNVLFFDDLYFCDDFDDGKTPPTNTFLGDVHCEYDEPTSDGTYVGEWSVVGGGTQHGAVDKGSDPTATTPSIESLVTGNRATNNYAHAAVVSGTVFNVGVHILAQKSDSGPVQIAPMIRRAGTDSVGPNYSPPQSASIYESTEFNRDPTDGNGWTIARYNAAEYGVKDTR